MPTICSRTSGGRGIAFLSRMIKSCIYCEAEAVTVSGKRNIIRDGSFFRTSDRMRVARYKCLACARGFSDASYDPCIRQKKRLKNDHLRSLLCSGVSQRRAAILLNVNKITVARKLVFLGAEAAKLLELQNQSALLSTNIQFDDMETFEHTKCKPLSMTLMAETDTRRILGIEVSQMPANGKLAAISRKKYGPRKDHRRLGRRKLIKRCAPYIAPRALIQSDMNPHYVNDVREFFPGAEHKAFKGKRGCIVGYGELKKTGFDPLFTLNHTCAMVRDNIKRLGRRTWCTTKRPDRLQALLLLYAVFHNEFLIQKLKPQALDSQI